MKGWTGRLQQATGNACKRWMMCKAGESEGHEARQAHSRGSRSKEAEQRGTDAVTQAGRGRHRLPAPRQISGSGTHTGGWQQGEISLGPGTTAPRVWRWGWPVAWPLLPRCRIHGMRLRAYERGTRQQERTRHGPGPWGPAPPWQVIRPPLEASVLANKSSNLRDHSLLA